MFVMEKSKLHIGHNTTLRFLSLNFISTNNNNLGINYLISINTIKTFEQVEL